MLTELKRGDRVVTGGGILGTVTKPPKPEDREIEVEIGAEHARHGAARDHQQRGQAGGGERHGKEK